MRGVPRERARDQLGRVVGDLDAEDARRAAHDRRELVGRVEVEPERQAEAVAQRRRQQAGARGRADQRERRQVERERARGRALPDDDVEPEVLERRVEDLLGGPVHPVDLVDEEHVARLERGEDRGDVALALERRARRPAGCRRRARCERSARATSCRARRPGEQNVVERLAARLRRLERDRELLLHALLADEVGEVRGRSERSSSSSASASTGASELRHAAARSACAHLLLDRKRRVDVASARSASSSDQPSSTSASRASVLRSPLGASARRAELLLQLEHHALRGLQPDAGDRLEALHVVAGDRAAELRRRRPRDDRERDLRPDPETPSSSSNSSRSSPSRTRRAAARPRARRVDLDRDLAVAEPLHRRRRRARGSRRRRRRRSGRRPTRPASRPRRRAIMRRASSAAAPSRGRSRLRARRPRGSGPALVEGEDRLHHSLTCSLSAWP